MLGAGDLGLPYLDYFLERALGVCRKGAPIRVLSSASVTYFYLSCLICTGGVCGQLPRKLWIRGITKPYRVNSAGMFNM